VSRILLLLDQKENRALLYEELARSHELVQADDDGALDGAFDLLLLDGRALDRLWERVQRRKEAEQPVFLPVLLVTSRPGVKMITRQLWRSVDELIVTPIEKPELRARVEILLRARGLSLELGERAREAERATHVRDDVLAVVSHDLRNPLNLVFTSSSFLLDVADDLPKLHREQLTMIRRAAGQMNRLIQDLLEVSRPATSPWSCTPSPWSRWCARRARCWSTRPRPSRSA
jgi:signal transduction histidine kinase